MSLRPQYPFPEISQDTIAALCAIGRQLAMRLDELIDLSKKAQGIAPGITVPGLRPARVPEWIMLMRLLLASFPRDHAKLTVSDEATPLVENPSGDAVPVLVTNTDEAKLLYYGSSTLDIDTAPVIQPRASLKILVPGSSSLYGLVEAGGDITAAISSLDIPGA